MKVLVEDTGVGTGLIAELKDLGILAIGVKPEGNKLARMATIGQIRGWPRAFSKIDTVARDPRSTAFRIPGGRHDDQVDSISQALAEGASGYDPTFSWV
jgi:phage terminase large subunit-like protein